MIDYIVIYFILFLLIVPIYLFGLSILKRIINKLEINTKFNLNKYEYLVLALIVYRSIWLFIMFFGKYIDLSGSEFITSIFFIFYILYFYDAMLYLTDFFSAVFVLICFLEGKVRKKIALIWLCSIIFFIAIDVCFYREYLPTPWL